MTKRRRVRGEAAAPLSADATDDMKLIHELWKDESEGEFALCLAGPAGDNARALLEGKSEKIWECEGECHFEVMTKYYEFQGWGEYTAACKEDYWPYLDKNGTIAEPSGGG